MHENAIQIKILFGFHHVNKRVGYDDIVTSYSYVCGEQPTTRIEETVFSSLVVLLLHVRTAASKPVGDDDERRAVRDTHAVHARARSAETPHKFRFAQTKICLKRNER